VTPLLAVAVSGVALAVGAPALLCRLPRLERWPLLAAWLWLAAVLGTLGAAALAGLLLVLPATGGDQAVARLLRTCAMAVRLAFTAPADGPRAVLGVVLLAVVATGIAVGVGVAAARTWRARRLHCALLRLAGRPAPGLPGITLLEHPVPLAWCLPGQAGPVVVSTAALDRLDREGLRARCQITWPGGVLPSSVLRRWNDQVVGWQALTATPVRASRSGAVGPCRPP
jgi:Zn-dependent protease with chaperone function